MLNLDDAMGAQLARRLKGRRARHRLRLRRRAPRSRWTSTSPAKLLPPSTRGQLGRFNLANALGVLGCLLAYGLAQTEALALLADLPPVPGRMQRVGDRPLVVVDYAHTPDALEKVLQALRPVGAGARRPAGGGVRRRRRPRPDQAAADGRGRRAPRRPGAGHLRQPAQRGSARDHRADRRRRRAASEVEADRARAIAKVIAEAAPSDVVLIAGKGHEDYQEIAGKRAAVLRRGRRRARRCAKRGTR